MLSWMTRAILLVLAVMLVVRAVWRVLVGFSQGMAGDARRVSPEASVPLVRDPVCGTFVVRARALKAGDGETVHYFCSERCRNAYEASRRIAQSATR